MNGFEFRPEFLGLGTSRVAPAEEHARRGHVRAPKRKLLRQGIREHAPRTPGIYAMLDASDRIVYVGKSKRLRARLLSYFRDVRTDNRVKRILARTESILWEELPSDFAALIRELELIRRFRPKFNVAGQPRRMQRTFLCIGRAPAPYLYLSPAPTSKVHDSFGPLPQTWRLREAVRHLNDIFRLRDCAQSQPMRFSDERELFPISRSPGCLRFDLGTCLGPCVAACSTSTYQRQLRKLRAFLGGDAQDLVQRLEGEMTAAAARREFETAAKYRDRWQMVAYVGQHLERLKLARLQYAFVYPVDGHDGQIWWHLICGGQVEATIPAPTDLASARRVEKLLAEVFARPARSGDGSLLEGFDVVLFVAKWFQLYPDELARTLPAEEALLACREKVTARKPRKSASKVARSKAVKPAD